MKKNMLTKIAIASSLLLSIPALAGINTSPGSFKSHATMYSIGMQWKINGDDNHNATCQTSYRKQGASSWKEAMPLYRVDHVPPKPINGENQRFNGFAGSVLFLDPATSYEVKLTLSDPDGKTEERFERISTQAIPAKPTDGRTFHVVPGNGGGDGSSSNPYKGIDSAQSYAQPGDIYLLHAGVYQDSGVTVLNKAGNSNNYIVWQSANDGAVIFDDPIDVAADYIWLEGVHLRGHAGSDIESGLRTVSEPKHVVVKGNKFTDFYNSIILNYGGESWYIVDNVIIGDKDVDGEANGSASWGGEGIELLFTGGHTIAYNSISRVADGISSSSRNTDIFRNEIFDVTDDGIEPDYGYENIRVWENRISNVRHNGLSFQPMNGAPWYFIRNQVAAPLESTLKLRHKTSRVLLAHNVLVGWDYALSGPWPEDTPGILSFESKNNIWISLGDKYVWSHGFSGVSADWRTSLDYDGFDWGNTRYAFKWGNKKYTTLADFQVGTGLQKHGIEINRESCFKTFNVSAAPPASMSFQHMSLKNSCNAVDAGVVLPNINDNFSGNAPDLGAFEIGATLPKYGPRTGNEVELEPILKPDPKPIPEPKLPEPEALCGGTYEIPNNEWHQVGLPCITNTLNTVKDVFGANISGTYGKDWNVFKFDAENNHYVELKIDEILEQGIGYWILQISGGSKSLKMPFGSVPLEGGFEVELHTQDEGLQWNMIGYPFSTTKALGDAVSVTTSSSLCNSGCTLEQAKNKSIVNSQIWGFNGKDYQSVYVSDDLNPWKAFWIQTMEAAEGTEPSLAFK